MGVKVQVDGKFCPAGSETVTTRPHQNHAFETASVSHDRIFDRENVTRYDSSRETAAEPHQRALTFKDAGEALRRLRQRRGWTLDEVAAMTGVAKMSISHIERATKVPRPSTVARLEAGLGWRTGSFYRLADAGDDDVALDELVDSFTSESADATPALPVRRIKGSEVLAAHVEAYVDMIDALIAQLPPPSNPRFAATVNAALTQCAKVTVLTATSWRTGLADREAAAKLLKAVQDLEGKRQVLLSRIPDSTAARFDAACRQSSLPDPLICVLTGLTTDESWAIRSGGTPPEGANARILAFIRSQLGQ